MKIDGVLVYNVILIKNITVTQLKTIQISFKTNHKINS